MKKLRVGYLLAYRDPRYVRTETLLAALQEIDTINLVKLVSPFSDWRRYPDALAQLYRAIRAGKLDYLFIGFRGHELYWPVRWITGKKTRIVFDAMMSPSAALGEEGKMGRLGRLLSIILFPLEKAILQNADLLITDTTLHVEYFKERFHIPAGKILDVPVGAREIETPLSPPARSSDFSALFYGSFLPLHGVDVIIQAASRLRHLPVRIDFIGGNSKEISRLHRLCKQAGVTRYTHRKWVHMDELLTKTIPSADICLGGPFGATKQALRVITGKTSQSLALGKATIVGRTQNSVPFSDMKNCLLVTQGSHHELAEKISWAYKNRKKLDQIGSNGTLLYKNHLSISTAKQKIIDYIK